jgi:hypothetical protein
MALSIQFYLSTMHDPDGTLFIAVHRFEAFLIFPELSNSESHPAEPGVYLKAIIRSNGALCWNQNFSLSMTHTA